MSEMDGFGPTTQRDDRKREEGTYFAAPGFDPARGQVWWVQNGTNDMIRIFYAKDAVGGIAVMPGGNAFFTGLGRRFGIYVFWDCARPQTERIYHPVVSEEDANNLGKRPGR